MGRDPSGFIGPLEGAGARALRVVQMTGNRDLTCDVCGESFDTKDVLGGHSSSHSRRISEAQLLAEIDRLVDEFGRSPTTTEMDTVGAYSAGTYENRFGSWTEALQSAGYEPVKRNTGFPRTQSLTKSVGLQRRPVPRQRRPKCARRGNSRSQSRRIALEVGTRRWRQLDTTLTSAIALLMKRYSKRFTGLSTS